MAPSIKVNRRHTMCRGIGITPQIVCRTNFTLKMSSSTNKTKTSRNSQTLVTKILTALRASRVGVRGNNRLTTGSTTNTTITTTSTWWCLSTSSTMKIVWCRIRTDSANRTWLECRWQTRSTSNILTINSHNKYKLKEMSIWTPAGSNNNLIDIVATSLILSSWGISINHRRCPVATPIRTRIWRRRGGILWSKLTEYRCQTIAII